MIRVYDHRSALESKACTVLDRVVNKRNLPVDRFYPLPCPEQNRDFFVLSSGRGEKLAN